MRGATAGRRRLGLVLALALAVGCTRGLDEAATLAVPATTPGQRPPGLYLTWLGTAGVVIDDGATRIVIDPFVTRDSMSHVLLGRPLRSDPELVDRWMARADATRSDLVIVTHSHYDHALDAPTVAMRTGAKLMGSADTLAQARVWRMDERQLLPARVGEPVQVGRFTVTLRPSVHGDPEFFRGHLEGELRLPVRAKDYRTGEVYAVLVEHPWGSLVHHGSAAWREDTYDESTRADVVLLGMAGRDDTVEYLHAVVDAVGAKRVIPMHFDDFFRPIDHRMHALRGVKLPELFRTAAEQRPDLQLQTLPLGEPRLVLPAPAGTSAAAHAAP